MLNTDKIRGIMRAKYGSQIPKFQTPSGPLVSEQQNPFMVGSAIATPGIPEKLENPIREQKEQEMELSRQAILNTTNNQKRQLRLARGLARGTHMVSNGEVVLDGKQLVKNVGNAVGGFVKDNATVVGQAATGLAGLAKNFSLKNPNLVGMGIDALGNIFDSGVTNNSGTQKIFGIGDTIANGLMTINPVAGLIGKGVMTIAKGINNVFGKKTKNFSTDTRTIEEIGGSYGGSVADINEAASKANTKYGLFSSGSRKAANRLIDSADYQQDIMADIAGDVRDQKAMINDLNYLRYDMDLMGGYDQRYMRAAKSGMKLQDKINFIKQHRISTGIINLDTKEIEWEPIIEDVVEEFKDGGVLPSHVDNSSINYSVCELEWEPIIESFEEWEPEIILEVEEFKDGGQLNLSKIKEYYKDYNLDNINFIYGESPRVEGNNLYVKTDEDAIHELWHFLSQNKPNEKYKEFYDNLNDDRITELGGDLNFVKRHEGDPGHFYHPSELEARIMAAKFKSQGQAYTKDFFKNLRSDENKYGYNMRDLLYMFNDENLEKIFNLKKGGTLGEELETPEIEETNQKNLIPEGALHKNKHHMEHTEGLTQKGIPVIDNDGEQQAEIELDEIIFTLEVTKKLEELYKEGTDEAAIEAGKLLVKEILFNTDDRTGLISKCEKGGKL